MNDTEVFAVMLIGVGVLLNSLAILLINRKLKRLMITKKVVK